MKIDTVRIISYFKEDQFLNKRMEAHRKQVEFFIELGLKIKILAIQYKPEWFINHPLIQYQIQSERTLPGSSRNILLQDFYSSDEDFSCFADNDSFWYNEGKYNPSGVGILDHIRNGVIDVDLFVPIDGSSTPYNEILSDPEQKKKIMFKRSSNFRGCLMFVKNFKKHYNEEIYFDVNTFEVDGRVIPGEDTAFGFSVVTKGYKAYRCESLILKEYMRNGSTWCTPETRVELNKLMNEKLINKFNLKLKSNGKPCYKTFFDKFKLPTYHYCPLNNDDDSIKLF